MADLRALLLALPLIGLMPLMTASAEDEINANKSAKASSEYHSIAVVNIAYLINNAPKALQANSQIKKRFGEQLTALDKDEETLRKQRSQLEQLASDKNIEQRRTLRNAERDLKRRREDYQEALRHFRQSLIEEVQEEVFNAISEVREQKQIDLVVQEYVSAAKSIDISEDVLTYLKNNPQPSVVSVNN